MASEIKILFENIKNLRHLITEGVGDVDIIKYIQNHEYVYIYYAGDEGSGSGYRTIRPYVLGTNMSGNKVLRAWQDNPKNSFHFDNRATRPDSKNHDFWSDEEGVKPGWRMFRLDKISKIYPIGKKFHDSNGLVMIPAGYHEGGDDNMTSIIAYVTTKTQPEFDFKYDKEFTGDELSKAQINAQKWDSIRRGNKNSKKITADDVIKLRDIASNVYKKGRGSFVVVIDNKQNFIPILATDVQKKNIPDSAIVGTLSHLYDSIVKVNSSSNDSWFKNQANSAKINMKSQSGEIKETNLPSIPFEKKTFFK